ncbi:unnamed protein product, partial [Ectocarpus sp. 4 AP-2014]
MRPTPTWSLLQRNVLFMEWWLRAFRFTAHCCAKKKNSIPRHEFGVLLLWLKVQKTGVQVFVGPLGWSKLIRRCPLRMSSQRWSLSHSRPAVPRCSASGSCSP